MARQWILTGQEGFEKSLQYQTDVTIPSPDKLAPNQVLVKLQAASLNLREINYPHAAAPYGPIAPNVIPGCDGAGVVEAIGSGISEFKKGDKVVTHVAFTTAEARGDDAFPALLEDTPGMLGAGSDGTLRSYGVFPEKALVHAPKTLEPRLAATLTCTFVSAWNALFGGVKIDSSSWILTQGSAGVSVAVLQIAVALGATVVATASSEEKAARLRSLGAKYTVNYRTNASGWGEEARRLTPDGRGFDLVADVGGNETLPQSLAAVRVNGHVALMGMVGKPDAEPVPLLALFPLSCSVRAIGAGTRTQFKDLVRFVDEKNVKPAVDDVVFELADAMAAYKRLAQREHFAKVIIRIDH